MKIHNEGYRVIPVITLAILVFDLVLYFLLGGSAAYAVILVVSLILLAGVFYFFREPVMERKVKEGEVVSVANGTVVAIEPVVEGEYFRSKRLQISVFMSVWDVHINHVPVAGEIVYQKHHAGRFLPARHAKSSDANERCTSVIRTAGGKEILARQVAGILARRVVTYRKPGDRVTRNDQLGFIRFGSRVDLFVPLDSDIRVTLGQKVRGGMTVITTV